MAGHLQHLCASVHSVLVSFEGSGDHSALKVRHRLGKAEVKIDFTGVVVGFPKAHFHFKIGQTGRLHFIGLFKNSCTFHYITQFAHIAGPIVAKQFS